MTARQLRAFGGPLDGALVPELPDPWDVHYKPAHTGSSDHYLRYEAAADEPHHCRRGLTMRASWSVLVHASITVNDLLPERCREGAPWGFDVLEDYATIVDDDAQQWGAGLGP